VSRRFAWHHGLVGSVVALLLGGVAVVGPDSFAPPTDMSGTDYVCDPNDVKPIPLVSAKTWSIGDLVELVSIRVAISKADADEAVGALWAALGGALSTPVRLVPTLLVDAVYEPRVSASQCEGCGVKFACGVPAKHVTVPFRAIRSCCPACVCAQEEATKSDSDASSEQSSGEDDETDELDSSEGTCDDASVTSSSGDSDDGHSGKRGHRSKRNGGGKRRVSRRIDSSSSSSCETAASDDESANRSETVYGSSGPGEGDVARTADTGVDGKNEACVTGSLGGVAAAGVESIDEHQGVDRQLRCSSFSW
jgi:hypothetical protein